MDVAADKKVQLKGMIAAALRGELSRAQARIYERIKDLSPQEEIDYFANAAAQAPLGKWWQAVQRRAPGRPSP